MFANQLKITDMEGHTFSVYINGSHVCVNRQQIDGTKIPVFQRSPEKATWYDATHKPIVDAIAQLEQALRAAAEYGQAGGP